VTVKDTNRTNIAAIFMLVRLSVAFANLLAILVDKVVAGALVEG